MLNPVVVAILALVFVNAWTFLSFQDDKQRAIAGKRRIPGLLPQGSRIAHKTGTLNNTASDVGIVHLPDGRAVALAIYVTGQGGKPNRDSRIATIARAVYDGYLADRSAMRLTAAR